MTDTDTTPPEPTGGPTMPAGREEAPAADPAAVPVLPAQPGPPVPPVPASPPAVPGPAGAARRWVLPVGTGVLGFLAGAAFVWSLPWGGGGSAAEKTFTLTGKMALSDSDGFLSLSGGGCAGKGGYKDIRAGASVTVYDDAGKVVATGSLGAGAREGLTCDFPVTVTGVPTGARFYQVEVSHRGKVTVPKEEAMAGGFGASLG
ncbi:hypothetical protein ABZZ17_00770 [Streptomyces sp. NPDC006512]|uniref:hypothetical protein n=1 Tax=Streptomyces sp. NPDC006512 TaxID=3154307 RepID=UPI0033A5AF6F